MMWRILVVLVMMISAQPAPAWNHTGHRVTAMIAWEQMTPKARTEAVRLLKAHPRYQQDLLRDLPEGYAEPEKWAFFTAAFWPDILRDPTNPMQRRHHKLTWHYINFAFAPDGDRRGFVDGDPQWKGGEPENILQALAKVTADLKDPKATDSDKAMALCWYLHLAGDLHQPLHAVSRVSADFPEGDRGASIALVLHNGSVMNLHAFWDDRLGSYVLPSLLERVAERVKQDYPREQLGDAARPAASVEIANESRKLAVSSAYLNGALKAVPSVRGQRIPAEQVPELPAGYAESSVGIARKRVAQAGYRMGAELNRLLEQAAPADPGAGRTVIDGE